MGSQLFPESLATLPPGPLSTGSAGLIGSVPMQTLRASSTPPGYSICAWQCSTNTNCYCISPRDILGSSQAGSSNAGTGGPSCQRRAAELLDRWPQCPLYSWLSMRSPKQAGLLGGLPTLSLPGSQVLAPLFFFSSPFASVLLMFPPPTPLLPIMGTP